LRLQVRKDTAVDESRGERTHARRGAPEIASRRIENHHRQLAFLAKQLSMVLEIQRYLETGSVEGLLAVLNDLGRE
jgi:hypothetical protein